MKRHVLLALEMVIDISMSSSVFFFPKNQDDFDFSGKELATVPNFVHEKKPTER